MKYIHILENISYNNFVVNLFCSLQFDMLSIQVLYEKAAYLKARVNLQLG